MREIWRLKGFLVAETVCGSSHLWFFSSLLRARNIGSALHLRLPPLMLFHVGMWETEASGKAAAAAAVSAHSLPASVILPTAAGFLVNGSAG